MVLIPAKQLDEAAKIDDDLGLVLKAEIATVEPELTISFEKMQSKIEARRKRRRDE